MQNEFFVSAPNQVVTNVKVTPTSGSSVLVTFEGIDTSKEPTFVGYQVEYFKHSDEDFDVLNYEFEFSTGNSTRMQEVNVFELEPSDELQVKVRAVNAGGLGPPSKQRSVKHTWQSRVSNHKTYESIHSMAKTQ